MICRLAVKGESGSVSCGNKLTRSLLPKNRQDALGLRHRGTIADAQLRLQLRSFGPAVMGDQRYPRVAASSAHALR